MTCANPGDCRRENAERAKLILVRASALVSLGLKSFEEVDTKNLRGDVYQANASIIKEYSLISLLEKRKKNGLTPVIFDSLTQLNFGYPLMEPWAHGVKARHVNLC